MALQMGFGLVQEQRMKLVMTPELRQAIEILQYSATDLIQYIQEQMTENPVLETNELTAFTEKFGEADDLAQLGQWFHYLNQGGFPRYPRYSRSSASKEEGIVERLSVGSESLAEALEAQLCYYHLDKMTKKVCLYLIHNLDERGYLDLEPESICKRLLIDQDQLSRSLEVLHSLDPAGVGARSLGECLEIQLLRKEKPNQLAIEIARNYLPDVADGKLRKIAHELQVEVMDVQRAVDEIKTCNPRPGSSYSTTPSKYVYPDVVVEKVDDEYVISMNESDMPRLTISPHYQQLMAQKDLLSEEESAYLKNWMQSALWLVKGIEQRRDTIYRVAETIVKKQQAFFKQGMDYLKPLTLKQVAEEVGLHESTISRATQHKYMQTPRGMFPFRFFFPSGLTTETGEDLSTKTVKNKIQQIIADEDKENPLSDQKISDILKAEGIRISRRTVAKYREEMRIGSSTARKRYKS